MPDIFDYHVLPETPFIRELAEELEVTFHVIAHAGHETNLQYILDRQRYFRRKYGRFLGRVVSDVGILHILPVYDTLQELLRENPSPDDIRQTCEECLNEHLIIGWEPTEEWLERYEEFFGMF